MLCLLVAVLLASALETGAQRRAQPDVIPPPAKFDLVPVHLPDLTRLEPEVRQELTTSQAALAAAVRNPASTVATLAEAYGVSGQIFHAYSLAAPARECYLNASRLAPKDFRWVYLLARLDQQEDRIGEAIRRYRAARALRPDYVAAPVNVGNIYLQLNRLTEARENFRNALTIEPNNPAANYGMGQVALSERNYADAVNYFEKALAQVPGASRIHYSLAMAYRGLGNSEKARAHLAQQGPVGARVADPLIDGLLELIAGERIHLVRGKLALESQRYVEAISEFQKVLAANPHSVEAHINLGAALTQTGDLRGAISHFEKAVRLHPTNANAHYNLAVLFAHEGGHEPAVRHLQSVLSTNPNDLSARFLLAQQLVKANRFDDALTEFSRVAQADPNNEDALLNQVKLQVRLRQFQQALGDLEKAHTRNPRSGPTAVVLAYLLAASPQRDLRNGARALELAQRIYDATGLPDHGAILAMALAESGRCAEAAELARRILAKAFDAGHLDRAEKMQAALNRYESAKPCRPAFDETFFNQLGVP